MSLKFRDSLFVSRLVMKTKEPCLVCGSQTWVKGWWVEGEPSNDNTIYLCHRCAEKKPYLEIMKLWKLRDPLLQAIKKVQGTGAGTA